MNQSGEVLHQFNAISLIHIVNISDRFKKYKAAQPLIINYFLGT